MRPTISYGQYASECSPHPQSPPWSWYPKPPRGWTKMRLDYNLLTRIYCAKKLLNDGILEIWEITQHDGFYYFQLSTQTSYIHFLKKATSHMCHVPKSNGSMNQHISLRSELWKVTDFHPKDSICIYKSYFFLSNKNRSIESHMFINLIIQLCWVLWVKHCKEQFFQHPISARLSMLSLNPLNYIDHI